MSRPRPPRALLALPLLLLPLAVPAAASAGTLTAEGDALVFRAAPGETNALFVNDANGTVELDDDAPIVVAAAGCAARTDGVVECAPLPGGVRAELGDGDDRSSVGYGWPATRPISVDGGAGNDQLKGDAGTDTLVGGDGNDTLKGNDGSDTLDGGGGDDDLSGDNGNDTVRGGDGSDAVSGGGTAANADVIDGGAGFDTIAQSEYSNPTSSAQEPVAITLDGAPNDGRPGEGDNVVGVEKLHLLTAADLTGGSEPVDFKVFHTGASGSRLVGTSGNDTLSGYDYDDTIDGGGGDDTLVGAYGNDTITGGAGRDTITADAINGCNFLECRPPQGNDTVNARDGEVDTISCGVGTDRVVADAADVVAPDCETVERPAAGGDAPRGGTVPRSTKKAPKLGVRVPAKLRASAVRRGTSLTVTAPKAGRLTLTLRKGKRTVATGSATAKKAGTVTIRIKARRRVGKGSYRLVLTLKPKTGKATTVSRSVKLR